MSKSKGMRPVDWEAREKIVTVLDKTFLVEAGAGSGKTRSLVHRMLACLRNGICEIDTLAAVTFTRKAAAELRERFQTNLERAYAGAEKETERRRLGKAMANLEQCFIGTIHSFCARMLRERPVEVSLMPDFTELDDLDDLVFKEKCWHKYLLEVRRENEPLLDALAEVGLELEDLKDAFGKISEFPEVKMVGGRRLPPDFVIVRKDLESFLSRVEAVLPKKGQEEKRDPFQKKMTGLLVRQHNIGFEDPLVLMETLEGLDKNIGITQKHWPDKDVGKSILADFEDFRASTVRPALREWREYRHSRAIDFLRPAIYFFKDERRKQSLVNFGDLLLSVSTLLKHHPDVREYFQKKFTHILVDEFQDTDPIQAEVLMYLTGEDVKETDWRKLKPRPGSLFLVGDPKQSIYRFRRADIDTYNLVQEQIERAGGDVLRLTSNFRSLNCLAEWNNPIFETTFPLESSKHQARYAPMNTVREGKDGTWRGVHRITVEKKKGNYQKPIAAEDSAKAADWIKWACDGNVRLDRTEEEREAGMEAEASPADFLLLFRYKKCMNIYARALEERGIPFEITGSDAFSDSEDILEIVNLARALRDPDNPVLTVGVLRGIFFGLSDNDLLLFKKAGGRFFFLPEKIEVKGPEGVRRVVESLGVLRKWWRWTKEYTPSVALEKICEDSGIVNYLAASDMGSSKAGNVFKLLELLRGRERDGVTDFPGIVEYMEELIEVHEVQEMSLTPGRVCAVRLMNLHKAKGLEAPVVFLANPVGTKYHPPDKHVVRTDVEGPEGYFLFSKKMWFTEKLLSQPLGWEERSEEEERYSKAEEERLMYVAATRAKNMMVISSYAERLSRRSWGLLDDNLVGVPELDIPAPGDIVKRKETSFPAEKYEGVRKLLRGNFEKAWQPSYLVESVTSLAKAEGEKPGWSEGGLGMSWGRVVHSLLDLVGRKEYVDLDLAAGNALIAEERELAEKGKLKELIGAITDSEFWMRMLRAEKKFFEMPFSLKTEGKDKKPVIVSGTIDLIFKEKDGWVIVDYKTDEITGDLQEFVDYYTPQVRLYSEFWQQITSETVKEAALYFTSIKKWKVVI